MTDAQAPTAGGRSPVAAWSTRRPVVAFTVLAYGISTLMGAVITVAGLAANPGSRPVGPAAVR
ncbi:MAG: hypothetical protein LH603_06315 [Pseudonocardia sp.]|nr:hypothetical protein [Pseudonocardia sp.]